MEMSESNRSSSEKQMCRNCAFDVNNVCIKRMFPICNDDQCCTKYIRPKC